MHDADIRHARAARSMPRLLRRRWPLGGFVISITNMNHAQGVWKLCEQALAISRRIPLPTSAASLHWPRARERGARIDWRKRALRDQSIRPAPDTR